MELTPQGYRVKTYNEILTEINNDIQSKIPNFSLDDSNPIIKMNKKVSDMLYLMSLMGLEVYSSFNINEASGKALEDRVFWLGISRIREKKSSGVVKFTGTENTVIPAGFRVATQDNKIYYTLGNVIIGSNGEADAFIESLNGGAKTTADIGMVNKIVNPLIGVKSVTNKSVISGGIDTETDAQLRGRYYNELLGLGKSTITSIKNAIILNTDATKVNLVENDSDVEKDNLPPHSFKCFVFGGTDNDILQQIYESRPAGIQPIGDIQSKIDGYDSAFSRPTPKPLYVSINIKIDHTASPINVRSVIQQNIIDAINNLNIGEKVSYTLFISALYKNTNNLVTSFDNLQFWINSGDKKGLGDELVIKSEELLTAIKENINLEVS